MMWYLTDGRSRTRPPRTRTTLCSCRLWPMPGMYAVTSIWFDSRTRAILRSAEFGFLGVIVRTWRQTPRFCGAPGIGTCLRFIPFQFLRMAGALTFEIFGFRPWRTSWLMVGTETLPFRFVVSDLRRSAGPGATPAGTGRGPSTGAHEAHAHSGHERGVYAAPGRGVKRATSVAE